MRLITSWLVVKCSAISSKVTFEYYDMIIEAPFELFVLLLSNVLQDTDRTTQVFQDFYKITRGRRRKEALRREYSLSQRRKAR
jgi:hypothetical protein